MVEVKKQLTEVCQTASSSFVFVVGRGYPGGDKTVFGTPVVDGASVDAKVLKQGKAKKVIVFKYKPKKGEKCKKGHRQLFTKVQIEKINA